MSDTRHLEILGGSGGMIREATAHMPGPAACAFIALSLVRTSSCQVSTCASLFFFFNGNLKLSLFLFNSNGNEPVSHLISS